jgi:hypothetical protein
MAVAAILLVAVVVVLLFKRLTRKSPIPEGLRPLPGPKGID